jgi:hypothetical protein
MISNDFKKLFFGFSFFGVVLFSTSQLQAFVYDNYVIPAQNSTELLTLPKLQDAKFIDNNTPATNKRLGRDLDISSGNHNIIVSLQKDTGGVGTARLYELDSYGIHIPTKTFKLNSSDDDADSFARRVAISDDFIALGTLTGNIYIYKKDASGNWPLLQKINIPITNDNKEMPFKFIYGNLATNLIVADKGSKSLKAYLYVAASNKFVPKGTLKPVDDQGNVVDLAEFPLDFAVTIPASGEPGGIIVASGKKAISGSTLGLHQIFKWTADPSYQWTQASDWENSTLDNLGHIQLVNNQKFLEPPWIEKPDITAYGSPHPYAQSPSPSPFGQKIALFKRDLLISAFGEGVSAEYIENQVQFQGEERFTFHTAPFYAGLEFYRADSTAVNAPFKPKSVVPPDPLNITNAQDPATAQVVFNDKPPVDLAFINQTLASVTNLGYLPNTATNPYGNKGYVMLSKRDSATETFKLYKVLLTPINLTTKLSKVAMSGQYVVAAAPDEPVDGVAERGRVFIWKYTD